MLTTKPNAAWPVCPRDGSILLQKYSSEPTQCLQCGYESYSSYEKTPLEIELERSLNDMREAYAAADTEDTMNVWLGQQEWMPPRLPLPQTAR